MTLRMTQDPLESSNPTTSWLSKLMSNRPRTLHQKPKMIVQHEEVLEYDAYDFISDAGDLRISYVTLLNRESCCF